MGAVTSQLSVSLDGFLAGPGQSADNPIGEGGLRLHDWHRGVDGPVHPIDADVVGNALRGAGAFIMGRNMFGPGRGAWDEDWKGWWGDELPYHAPTLVLTHHPREPVAMQGGTTFHFITDGIEAALEQAHAFAGDKDVAIAGGASTVRQFLAAGLIDELTLHIVPVVLGAGERLLEGIRPAFEPIEAFTSPAVTHVRFRVAR